MKGDHLRGHLDLLLLSVLDHEPRHGYAIIRALRERSGDAFDAPEGTVYPALHRLEEEGLVASTWQRVDGRRRRVYRLSDAGAVALAMRRAEWTEFVARVEGMLRWAT